MDDRAIRLECLRLAMQRVGPAASIDDLFREASRMLAFVDGLERVVTDQGEVWGKAL